MHLGYWDNGPRIDYQLITYKYFWNRQFLENGYDDLETVKKMGEADLVGAGVKEEHHRQIILTSVQMSSKGPFENMQRILLKLRDFFLSSN